MSLAQAFCGGVVAGLRSMMAPALLSRAVCHGTVPLRAAPIAFLANGRTASVLEVMAACELVADKLPFTPDRRKAPSFIFRIGSGALVGAVLGGADDAMATGLLCGALGAVCGTLGGAAVRARLAAKLQCDFPAAVIEDAAAISTGLLAFQRYP